MSEDVPIIMLSGMGADERLFEAQLAAFPNLRVQPWVPPFPGESLRQYATRLAPLVDPGRPCIVGGASFGGVVALELASQVPALACVLIGSIRSPAGLPWRWQMLRPAAEFGPEMLRWLAACVSGLSWFLSPSTTRRFARLARPEASFVRWAMCEVVRWQPSPASRRVRTFHIHGEADRVLPVELASPDVIVHGGSHALTLFNPKAVNEFLACVVVKVQAQKVGN